MSELTYVDGGSTDYQPGVCNIGPGEIRRRRRAGHGGLVATVGLLAGLIAIGAPPAARLLVGLPAAVSASGYLQAQLRFCAAYGARGVFNLGEEAGITTGVASEDARAADRRKANLIGVAAGGVGAATAIVAVLLPS